MKKLFVVAMCIFNIGYVQSQQIVPCATDELYYQAKKHDPSFVEAEQKANKVVREQSTFLMTKKASVIYIPVVFHVIHTNGQENITMAQINDQIKILNDDYRKRSGTPGFSDDPLAADMEIEFRLAQYDPSGNKHDGVNRIYNTATENAGNNVKALSYWNSTRYLNVWVVKSISSDMAGGNGVVLGYAQFPFMGSPSTDGVVVRADCVGKGFGTLGPSQVGRTLTHEVGHWLGLYHPFQDGCVGVDANSCSYEGDQVCDTPPVGSSASGCPTTRNSCTSDVPDKNDLIKNYMDYADGVCTNMFTAGQKTRAQGMIYGYRSNIFSNSNLASAGISSTDGSYLASTAATLKAPYVFGFETTNLAQSGWKVVSQNNPSWKIDDTTKFSGNYSLGMRNFYSQVAVINTRDWFVSPDIDLSTLNTVNLSFDYALARRSTANNDSFNVWISNDYGLTEKPLLAKIAVDLATAPNQTTNFNPDNSQWKNISIDISQYKSYTHARFRFEFVNRRGNNVFVDNFSITSSTTGVNENLKQEFAFNVYPNPAQQNAHITFDNKQAGNIKITLKDLMGREVKTFTNGHVSAGLQDIFITTDDVAKGIYLVHFENEKGAFSHKLVVN